MNSNILYDPELYISPYWEGDTVFRECVFPITGEDGSFVPYTLMYDAVRIISVTNYTLTETYTEGEDYVLRDGKLCLLPGTHIPVIDYGYIHRKENPDKEPMEVLYPRLDREGYEYWNEENELSEALICVTYVHDGKWHASVPESFGDSLPLTMSKLRSGDSLKICAIGDSVTVGAKASKNCGIPPHAEPYINMAHSALMRKFGNEKITLVNSARGGDCSNFVEDQFRDRVIKHEPDLLIIAYGMNDSSYEIHGLEEEAFRKNILKLISAVREHYPQCEILLIVSLYGNPLTFHREKYENHGAILHEIASSLPGVAVCDPQRIEKDLLRRKDFLCFMADNMVHPNDFGMRLIAQCVVKGFE